MILLTLFLFLCVNLLFMPKFFTHDQDGRITAEFYREKVNTDVLFVGSSTVHSGINPVVLWEDYGMTSFDRSNASQTSWISYYMIKDALEVCDPKLVVLDLGFFRHEDDYVEEASNHKAFDDMRISKTKFKAIEAAKSPDETYQDYIFPILRFHTRWKYLEAEDWKYMFYKPTVTYNGYLCDTEVKPVEREREEADDAARMSARNALFLDNIIALCKEHNVPLLLIKVPTYDPKWGTAFEEDILTHAGDVPYVDFNAHEEAIGLDFTVDTPDGGGHLNVTGAEKFTKYLGEYIAKNYEIPDHREDPEYVSAWQEKCERFHDEQR